MWPRLVLAGALLLALCACEDVPATSSPTAHEKGESATPSATGSPWAGARFLPDGQVDVSGFNAHLDARAEVASDAATVARLLFRLAEDQAEVRQVDDDGQSTVTLTVDTSMVDDSVSSQRFEAVLERSGAGWHVLEARWSQACRSGRGHTDYSAEPCV